MNTTEPILEQQGHTVCWPQNRVDETEESISELENHPEGIAHDETKRKKMKNRRQALKVQSGPEANHHLSGERKKHAREKNMEHSPSLD